MLWQIKQGLIAGRGSLDAAAAVSGFAYLGGASAGSTGASTGATTTGFDTTGANLIVVALSFDGGSTPTLSDSKGNTWTALTLGAGSPRARLYYCQAPSVGSGHTFSISGTNTFGSVNVQAFSGAIVSPFDVENTAAGTSTSPQAGSITPGFNNELVVAATATGNGNINSIDGGFTSTNPVNYLASNHYGIGIAYLIQTTAAAANPTWTLSVSGGWAARIASFRSV